MYGSQPIPDSPSHDLEIRIRVQHAAKDQLGHALDHAQLEYGEPAPHPGVDLTLVGRPADVDRRANGVHVDGHTRFSRDAPQRRELGTPQRHEVVRQRELDSLEADLRAAAHLVDRDTRCTARQTANSGEAVGTPGDEFGHEVVVDPHDGNGDFRVLDLIANPQNSVDHFARDPVPVLNGDPQVGIGRVHGARRQVVPETRLVHAIETPRLTGDIGLARIPRAAHQCQAPALAIDPDLSVVGIHDVRHATGQGDRRARRKEVGGENRQVQVAIGGQNSIVVHPGLLDAQDSAEPRSGSIRQKVEGPQSGETISLPELRRRRRSRWVTARDVTSRSTLAPAYLGSSA
jgi:hypothetical protein